MCSRSRWVLDRVGETVEDGLERLRRNCAAQSVAADGGCSRRPWKVDAEDVAGCEDEAVRQHRRLAARVAVADLVAVHVLRAGQHDELRVRRARRGTRRSGRRPPARRRGARRGSTPSGSARPRPSAPGPSAGRAPSSSGSPCSSHGSTPATGTPVSRSSSAGAGGSSDGSPRNLFSTNAADRGPVAARRAAPTCRRGGRTRPRGRCRRRAAPAPRRHGRRACSRGRCCEVDLGRAPAPSITTSSYSSSSDPSARSIGGQSAGAALAPRQRAQRQVGPAVDHDLAAAFALRLHEHRVHADIRLDSRRERLEVLRDADLAAVDDPGVVRHVLPLERRHPHARAARAGGRAPSSRGSCPPSSRRPGPSARASAVPADRDDRDRLRPSPITSTARVVVLGDQLLGRDLPRRARSDEPAAREQRSRSAYCAASVRSCIARRHRQLARARAARRRARAPAAGGRCRARSSARRAARSGASCASARASTARCCSPPRERRERPARRARRGRAARARAAPPRGRCGPS